MSFQKDFTNVLEYTESLITLQTSVLSKKVKRSIFYSDNEEMLGKDVSASVMWHGEMLKGVMFNCKQCSAIKDNCLKKLENISGIRAIEKGTYNIADENNEGVSQLWYVEVLFDDFYPRTEFNMRRVAGVIDIALA